VSLGQISGETRIKVSEIRIGVFRADRDEETEIKVNE